MEKKLTVRIRVIWTLALLVALGATDVMRALPVQAQGGESQVFLPMVSAQGQVEEPAQAAQAAQANDEPAPGSPGQVFLPLVTAGASEQDPAAQPVDEPTAPFGDNPMMLQGDPLSFWLNEEPIVRAQPEVTTAAVNYTQCFPTCKTNDGQMLTIPGTALDGLVGVSVNMIIEAPPGTTTFELGIFDGDTGKPGAGQGHWDAETSTLVYRLFAVGQSGDTLIGEWNGNAVNPLSGPLWATTQAQMPDNAWWNVTITTSPSAQTSPASGFTYRLEAHMPGAGTQAVSNYKLGTTASLSIGAKQVFGIEGALREFDVDVFSLYPTWNGTAEGFTADTVAKSTYTGTWTMRFMVPPDTTEVAIWDGDFDFGSDPSETANVSSPLLQPIPDCNGVFGDTDDPDTPGAYPATPGTDQIPPWAVGTDARNEGVADAISPYSNSIVAGLGLPPDEGVLDAFRRMPCVGYRVIDPKGAVYENDNPSGNLEWEQFLIEDGGSALPPGVWTIEIKGLDLANGVYFYLPFEILGQNSGALGDRVWFDKDQDGVQDDGEPGIPGVKVNLYRVSDNALLGSAVTGPDGFYPVFSGLPPGDYKVVVDTSTLPLGLVQTYDRDGVQTSPHSDTSNLSLGETDLNYDFGYWWCVPKVEDNCITVELLSVVKNVDGTTTYRWKVTNRCGYAISYVAFELPAGTTATSPTGAYTSPSGRTWSVVNPTSNPFYSIKFENPAGPEIKNGLSEEFTYTLPKNAPLQTSIQVKVKYGQNHFWPTVKPGDCIPKSANCSDVMSKLVWSEITVSQNGGVTVASVSVKNNSNVPVLVGMASYRKYDEIIDNQLLFDSESKTVQPGQTVQMSVDLPKNQDGSLSAVQVDAFCGEVLQSLNGNRYASRLGTAKHLYGTNWSTPLPPADSCPATLTGLEGLTANSTVQGNIKVKAKYTGQPLKVLFALVNSSGQTVKSNEEHSSPYCFIGDNGTVCNDWDTGSHPAGAYKMKATGYGIFGMSLQVPCSSIAVPFTIAAKAITPTGKTAGLNYKYYEGDWTKLPDFGSGSVKSGTVSNFTLSPKNRNYDFGFKFTGYIWIGKAGTYTFYTKSDDGSKLYIDVNKVVDNDGQHSALEKSGSIYLNEGWHSIDVRYFENSGDEVLEVRYKGPDTNGNKVRIPNDQLFR
jgi:hypothetical protein